jgi:PAS domain S-box-containing protein
MSTAAAADQLSSLARELSTIPPATNRRAGTSDDIATEIQRVVDEAPLPTLVCDDRGRYVAVSRSACGLVGYSCDELRGRHIWDLTAGTTQSEVEPLWRAFVAQGRQRGTYTLQHREGALVNVDYIAQANVIHGYHVSVLDAPPDPP